MGVSTSRDTNGGTLFAPTTLPWHFIAFTICYAYFGINYVMVTASLMRDIFWVASVNCPKGGENAAGYCVMRVLIIEDNVRLARLVGHGIGQCGFSADIVGSIGETEAVLAEATYDAIILDLGLPDGDGLAWLRRDRPKDSLPPILILTARDGLGERVAGLDAGADDYLVKPVEIDELAARLRALLRRPGPRSLPVIRAGKLAFDVAARSARSGDHAIELSRREADLLELLVRRAGTVVRRSTIEEALYGFDEPVTPNAVEAIVSRLRHKLADVDHPDAIVTVRGMGYLLKDPGK